MNTVLTSLDKLREINSAYELPVQEIENLQKEIPDAKVCTPIIGKFSSGKSALVNTVMGYGMDILPVDITPETAVPAEIRYTELEEEVCVIFNDGSCKKMDVSDYCNYELDASNVKCVQICLDNSTLKEFPDVMLVDMPGFESGYEIHNKAIDNYLPQSLAYIVTFPADDIIVRSSVGNILKELCLHDMPICIVITKYDKRNDDFEETFSKMKESLKRFVGDCEIRYCLTSSFDLNVEEVIDFLKEVQEKSQIILASKYKKVVWSIAENTEKYLATLLNNSQLSESELDEEEEKLKKQLTGLEGKFSKEKADFDSQIADCVEEIKKDVQIALEAEESTFVAMALNSQNINEHVNTIVRNAVTVSVKKRLIPKIERYMKRVENCINTESLGNVHIAFQFDTEDLNKKMTSPLVAAVAGLLIGLPITGLLSSLIVGIISKFQMDKKRDEAKQQIRMKLHSDVFPQILQQVGQTIEMAVQKQIMLVNTSVEEEIMQQRETLEKAMSDVRTKMNDEKSRKENLETDVKNDLACIGELKSLLQN